MAAGDASGLEANQCDLLIYVKNTTESSGCAVLNGGHSDEQQQRSCASISSAFNYIATNANSIINCVHVSLSSGDHIFTQPVKLNVSLILTGNGSTIQCDYDNVQRVVYHANNLQYTLSFVRVHLVKFEMVRYEKCKQPFRLEEVENVMIIDSFFTQFTDSVFDIYNCMHIDIDNSMFINNIGHGTVLLALRGNTGAVSIGYSGNATNFKNGSMPTVTIIDCHFIANDASVKANTFSTSTTAFLYNRYTGRGGSLAILMGLNGNLVVNIRRCLFQQNHAVSFG